MKKFMVVCWYYDEERNLLEDNVVFYNSLCDARMFADAFNATGDKAQLYMWQGGPDGYYVYCNE